MIQYWQILGTSAAAILSLSALAAKKTGDTKPAEPQKEYVTWPDGGETGTIPVDGGNVYYHLYGKGKPGTPMVFLHGGPGGNCACFFRQIPLAEERPLLFFNQLGCSGSNFSEEIQTAEDVKKLLTISHYVEEVDSVIHYFGFQEFILVGSSWGTMLAVEYAAAKKPIGLKGLALTGPFLNVDTWIHDAERLIKTLDGGEEMWKTIRRCEETGNYSNEYTEINKTYSANFNCRIPESRIGTPTEPDVKKIDNISVYNYMWGPSEFSCTGTLRWHDSTRLLPSITVPILYISGQYDSGTPEAAFHYQSMTPHGEVCVLPACSHSASRERYKEFNAVLKGFAARLQ